MSTEGWLTVVGLLIQAVIFGVIFRKAGYSGWLGLLMAIPLVNFVTLLWFATAHWPLEMGYVGQGDDYRVDAGWELKMAVRKALALERRGNVAAAIKQFEFVEQKAGEGHPSAAMARERLQQLRARHAGHS
ncbi:MAG TPA: hypothetical protein VGZ47_15890 [Gemmataceae bacterium]|jgi:hypothetical protein|nr:hypothetical protein [Gemmataceae bacterium]